MLEPSIYNLREFLYMKKFGKQVWSMALLAFQNGKENIEWVDKMFCAPTRFSPGFALIKYDTEQVMVWISLGRIQLQITVCVGFLFWDYDPIV